MVRKVLNNMIPEMIEFLEGKVQELNDAYDGFGFGDEEYVRNETAAYQEIITYLKGQL